MPSSGTPAHVVAAVVWIRASRRPSAAIALRDIGQWSMRHGTAAVRPAAQPRLTRDPATALQHRGAPPSDMLVADARDGYRNRLEELLHDGCDRLVWHLFVLRQRVSDERNQLR